MHQCPVLMAAMQAQPSQKAKAAPVALSPTMRATCHPQETRTEPCADTRA
jgi:hypothetical protein